MADPLIQHYKDGQFGVPVALPNRTFDPKCLELWTKFDDMPTGARCDNLRDVRREGLLQITLFCPTNTTTDAINDLADKIIKHFKTETSYQIDNHQLIIYSSYRSQGLPDGQWYMLPITINYHIIELTNALT